MKLKVPIIRQTKDSKDCGLVSLEMILAFHGRDDLRADLAREVTADHHGTYAPQLGSFLIKNGFQVEIVMLHPSLMSLHENGISGDDLLKRFGELHPELKSPSEQKVLTYFLDFIREGGKIDVKIPGIEDIESELREGRPVLADMTTHFLYRQPQPGFNLHFNVVTGLENEVIHVNDPIWDECGGEKNYPQSDWLYGLHSSVGGGFHEGTLTKIRPGN